MDTNSQLFNDFRTLLDRPIDIGDIQEPFKQFFPRMDYYISWVSAATGKPLRELVQESFKGGLLRYAGWCIENGYIGTFGNTVDPASFILSFPSSKISLIWIPKNSCTSIKKTLVSLEPSSAQRSITQHRFHETCQTQFGPLRVTLANESLFPKIALVRNPVERIVSCYLDKFAKPVVRGEPFEKFVYGHIRAAYSLCGVRGRKLDDSISFSEFIWYILNSPSWTLNVHWRPQSDFLGTLGDHTDLFAIEDIDRVWERLGLGNRQKAFNRSFGGRYRPTGDGNGKDANTSPAELDETSLSSYARFINPMLARMIERMYEKDFELYDRARTH